MPPDMDYFTSALISASASTSTPDLTTPRPPRTKRISPNLMTERAHARAARQREIEAEERREDQAALVMTPAQWALLHRSFVGVKTEFTDLDGLSWDAQPRSGGAYQPLCASAPDDSDSTVRPYQRQRQRLSVSAPGWEQAGSAMVARS